MVFLALNEDGTVTAEEHIASPPEHAARIVTGLHDEVDVERISYQGRRTVATFSIPLRTGQPDVLSLQRGEFVEMILAYSVSDDLDHHSRVREHLRVQL